MMKPITIVGGGLSGLALGIALRRRGIPVTLHDASVYPRHRVCGEFLSGVSGDVLESLGVAFALRDAEVLRSSCWHDEAGRLREMTVEGRGISRHRLDNRLQERFRELGGALMTGSRQDGDMAEELEGVIWAAGRRKRSSPWIGLKCHFRNLPLTHDLEMHVGRKGYLGMARIGEGLVNVCGLFRKNEKPTVKGVGLLHFYLRESGLHHLLERVSTGNPEESSLCGVAGISFAPHKPRMFCIGDAAAMIPPFTGNGMSMALEAAFLAIDPALAYAEGRSTWRQATERNTALASRIFGRRLRLANLLHPLITRPHGMRWARRFGMARFLPFKMLYHALR